MSAHDEQLCRQFRCRAQDRRRRRSIAKQATAFGLEVMHALVKLWLPEPFHLVAEFHRRHAVEFSINGTHHREQIHGMNDSKVSLAVPCLGCSRFNGWEGGIGKVGRCQYLSRRRGPHHKNWTIRIANNMLRSAAKNVRTAVIDLSPDDHGSCPDIFGSPEYSRMHRTLFNLDFYLGRLPSRHRSNALQKSVADRSLQIIELQSVLKMQLRKQGPHSKDLGEDMTDSKFDAVRTCEGVRLTKEIIGSFIEIHRSKNRTFDLKQNFLLSEEASAIPLITMRSTPSSSRWGSQIHNTIGAISNLFNIDQICELD
jgi:hypothetical protein